MSDRLEPLKKLLGPVSGEGREWSWWILPSPDRPRLLVPTDRRYWNEALAFLSSRKRRLALKVLLTFFGVIRRRPDLVHRGELPEPLKTSCPDLEHLAGYFGTPSRFVKYTLALLDSGGRPLAFAKLAEGADSVEAIEAEAKALEKVSEIKALRSSVPTLLHRGQGFSIQSGAPGCVETALEPKAGQILEHLYDSERRATRWSDSQSRKLIDEAIAETGRRQAEETLRRLERIRTKLDRVLEGEEFDEGLTHGDFLPWNMVNTAEGFVYDWEWMARRSQFYDHFHFCWFQQMHCVKASALSSLRKHWVTTRAGGLFQDSREMTEALNKHALLYLGIAFCFYTRHCIANGNELAEFPFILNLEKAFDELAERPVSKSLVSDLN